MSLKFKDEIDFATFDNLMKNENIFQELSCLASKIKKEIVQVLNFFSLLLRKI